jgi:putative ABC transport system permease protein
VQSVERAGRVHLGFDADRLMIAQLRLRSAMLDSARQVALRGALLERAAANPSIESATLIYSVPLSGTRTGRVFVPGLDSTNHLGEIIEQAGSPTYFRTTGTRIVRGRGITVDDREGSALVAVVSEGLARALWPNGDPLGQCMRTRTATSACRTVVGVAEDVRLSTLESVPSLMYYVPIAQSGAHMGRLFLRVRGDVQSQATAIARDLQRVMPVSSYLMVRPMTSVVDNATRSWRLGATLFAAFGALALILAAIGLYSVMAYAVVQRRHEMSVRIALGARVRDVVTMVVRDGLRVVGSGIAVGVGIAMILGPWFGALLFQVSPRDPWVFAAVIVTLLGVALAATGIPAIRAARVDPATALRSD